MDSPHSLPLQSPLPAALASSHQSVQPKRNSLNQLPLPPSLSTFATQWTQGSSAAGPNSPTRLSSTPSPTFSPTMPTRSNTFELPVLDITSPVMKSPGSTPKSTTHAGGIQPPASFFKPSRPRPISMSSGPQEDIYPLSSLTKRNSTSSEAHSVLNPDMSVEEHNSMGILRGLKSREPLLPIGERPTPMHSRPSVNRERSGASNASNARNATGRLVRNSLEVVFNLRRGMSFESMRKVGENGFSRERKFQDEENGVQDHSLDMSAADSSFAPNPPPSKGPKLSAVPIVDPKTNKPVRNYQIHPSRNRFFLGGRILTGGDSPWAFIASFSLILSISGIWFGTTCVWWWNNKSPAVAAVGIYMALLVITTMFRTATTDPGILPRDLDPDPPYPASSSSNGSLRTPMPRDLKVRSDVVRVKYCPTCKLYRPPRSSHCKMCDNCVDGCDHHCQWVNNCIGRRNYTTFFILLLFTTLTLILIICTSALHIRWLAQEGGGIKRALRRGVGSAIVFSMSITVFWPVAALFSYHLRLLFLNVTTIEQIRNQAHKSLVQGPAPPNPFSHGNWRRNLLAVIARPRTLSWLDPAGVATEDKREVNPGLLDDWETRRH